MRTPIRLASVPLAVAAALSFGAPAASATQDGSELSGTAVRPSAAEVDLYEVADEATAALEAAPPGDLEACVESAEGVEVCAQKRPADAGGASARGTQSAAAFSDDPFGSADDTWTPLCTGSGSDGFRVQVVLAHTSAVTAPKLAEVRHAVANADLTFSESAADTGGSRRVRWKTDTGSAGCQVDVRTAAITSGAASWDALRAELIGQGVIAALPGNGDLPSPSSPQTKYLIWTEGDLIPSDPGACGVGIRIEDDWAGSFDNFNTLSTPAAVKQPCWDINGGGSVPAHELMHTLGAVQDSAPHYNGMGHCTDDYDLMCYGPTTAVVAACNNMSLEALFDCGHDDYFHTDPAPDSKYLCRHWNTARSPFLQGYANETDPLSTPSATVTGVQGGIKVSWSAGAGCPGPSAIGIDIPGLGTGLFEVYPSSVTINAPAGSYTVEVAALRDDQSRSVFRNVTVPETNKLPYGDVVLSLTDGRGYGMLAWAVDPETGGPVRMRVVIPGVTNKEFDWNYVWADMPRFTGVNRTEALVFLAQLPPGTHTVCFDALDPQGGGWTRLECNSHTVK